MRRLAVVAVVAAAALGLPALPATAHAIGGRLDLPVPLTYFIVGAGLVVAVSFGLLAALWPRARLQDGPRLRDWRAPWFEGLLVTIRWLGVVGLVLVIAAGAVQLFRDGPAGGPTMAPVLVWVVFWLVIPFASVLVGDIYTVASPWRTLADLLRLGTKERAEVRKRWGVWPAAVLFVAFAWMELVLPASGSPVTLGTAALLYTTVLLVAVAVLGRETGLGTFDMFTIYSRLFSGVAPLGRRDGDPVRRGWLRALPVLPEWPGLWAFVVVAIGTVSYDGLSVTDWWPFDGMIGGTLGLVGAVLVVGAAYLGACWMADLVTGGGSSALRVAQRFAHTLVPIAIAYAVAHYLTLILFEGQQLISAASDPFGLGWDLFGTADRRIDFFLRDPEPVWYAQVGLIVAGHVLAVVLAHDRALHDFAGRDAVRSQYAMLVLMVLLTGLGLFLLAG